MEKKIVVAGHISVDITPVFQSSKKKSISQVLCPGKLIRTGEAVVYTGGVVSNTGLALHKMGANVRLAGKIGKDALGEMMLAMMKQHGTEKDLIIDENADTSYTVVIAPPGIDRIFLHGPGANDTFVADDLSDDLIDGAALVHFGYPPLMRKMYENDGAELVKLCNKVHAKGAAMSLDLAAVDPESPEGLVDWREFLSNVLPHVDFFVPSIEELCFMLVARAMMNGGTAGEEDVTEIIDLEKDIRPLAAQAMELGVKVLMLKCGARGMYYQTAGADLIGKIPAAVELKVEDWTEKSGFQKSFIPEKVLSGTRSRRFQYWMFPLLHAERLSGRTLHSAGGGAGGILRGGCRYFKRTSYPSGTGREDRGRMEDRRIKKRQEPCSCDKPHDMDSFLLLTNRHIEYDKCLKKLLHLYRCTKTGNHL